MARAMNVILVHGAWADGSSWAKVLPILHAKGLRPTAVQMALASLEADVATVEREIALADGPVILVGHSYGGAVITEAGNDPKVVGLVYIAAFAPDAGESAGSLGASVDPTPMGAQLRPDANGFLKITEEGVRNDFAQDLSDTEKFVTYAVQSPAAGAALGAPIQKPAWKSKPTWYLVASQDRAIQPSLERTMAARMKAHTVEVAASHVAMLSHPQVVADLIAAAAD